MQTILVDSGNVPRRPRLFFKRRLGLARSRRGYYVHLRRSTHTVHLCAGQKSGPSLHPPFEEPLRHSYGADVGHSASRHSRGVAAVQLLEGGGGGVGEGAGGAEPPTVATKRSPPLPIWLLCTCLPPAAR